MQMSVDKAGGDIATPAVNDLGRLVGTGGIVATVVEHADDYAILDGNATGRHALAIYVDNLRIGKQRVDGHAALGCIDHRPHDLNGHTYSFNCRNNCGADEPSPQQANSHCMPKRWANNTPLRLTAPPNDPLGTEEKSCGGIVPTWAPVWHF